MDKTRDLFKKTGDTKGTFHARMVMIKDRNSKDLTEAAVRTGHGKTDWFQIGKGIRQVLYCQPAYLTYMQSTSCKMLGWMNRNLESRFLGEISTTSDIQIIPL